MARLGLALWLGVLATGMALGEGLRVDYVHYRPARWNARQVTELESEHPNQGGLLHFYITNTGEEAVDLRFWRYNNRDESYWLLNHFIAWHRLFSGHVEPGETTVLEIDAISRDFSPKLPYVFELVDDSWGPCLKHQGTLEPDAVNVSFIRVLPGMRDVEVHLRHTGSGQVTYSSVEFPGRTVADVQWRGQTILGPRHSIARVSLAEPIPPSALLVLRVGLTDKSGKRAVYAHRRAFADYFPVGTWGVTPENRDFLRGDLVDTVVQGGRKDDEFFRDIAGRYGFHAMVHTGEPVHVDMVRDLSGHPSVACWMLRDEPDWSHDPQIMLFCDMTVRRYDSTKPTFLNLCRNAKFFEYAPIADIAGHDHYCVTAPSSSVWPHPYGTYLEETAYYTEDLKRAAEPRPIWVWSQGNHDGWSERPARPVPTAEELSAQLILNLGRGAKGILWFIYSKEMSEKYPETRRAMRGWNRVMSLLREDLLGSEPVDLKTEAPPKVDVAPLVTWDRLILCITNLDYEIDPKAYPFQPRRDVQIALELPPWIEPEAALRIAGEGVSALQCRVAERRAVVTLDRLVDAAIVVLPNDRGARQAYKERFRALAAEGS